MPAPKVRGQYAELNQIAQAFGSHAEQINAALGRIKAAKNTLSCGDWIGRGASAFYGEMDSQVLPALQRLVNALQQAKLVTGQMSAVVKQAEEDAAACFRLNDAGATASAANTPNPGATTNANGATANPPTSGLYKIGDPQRPNITHDDGFLGRFPPREPGLGDYLELAKWRVKLEGAEVLRPDLTDGLAAYRHFLDGNGADRTLDYERYIQNDPSGQVTLNNVIADAQKAAEDLSNQQSGNFKITSDPYSMGGSDPRFPYPATENWQKAIGGHAVWSSADVTVTGTPPHREYTMTTTLHAEDRYNFNPNANDIATGIPDDVNGQFELTGLAHQYTNTGQVTRVVTWREGEIAQTVITDTDTSRNRQPSDNRRLRNRL